jgi:thymidylate synthase (FAD)
LCYLVDQMKGSKMTIDTGYVFLIDQLGTDLDIVNAARVSFNKESHALTPKDERLLKYLWQNQHTSPFRMVTCKFKIKAPIFVLRQWMKHVVGCTWNEVSARYTEVKHECFTPDTWRLQHETSKQSSYGQVDKLISDEADKRLLESYEIAYKNYRWMLDHGICREQARMQLPVGTYSECIWKADLQAVFNFLSLRLDPHAQEEIREYAKEVHRLVSIAFPEATRMWELAYKIDQELADQKKALWDKN